MGMKHGDLAVNVEIYDRESKSQAPQARAIVFGILSPLGYLDTTTVTYSGLHSLHRATGPNHVSLCT